jgi:hypothetical protein
MARRLHALHHRVRTLALAACLVVGASHAAWPADPGPRIDWDHPQLRLYLSGVSDAGDRAQIELCVDTHPGVGEGSTYVGYPRYRTASGRWVDSVIRGAGSGRSLHATAAGEPACFSLSVAHDATVLALPLGAEKLQLEIGAWLDTPAVTPRRGLEVEDPWEREAVPQEPEAEVAAQPQEALPEIVLLTGEVALEGTVPPVARDRIVGVRLRARNVGLGTAHDVVAWIEPASGVFPAQDGAARIDLGQLAPGASAEFVYRCYADRRATALSFQVAFDHASAAAGGRAAVVSLPLADSVPPISDVDRDVPRSPLARPHGLAVVLGVEADADARTAARYFERALGIPPERIELVLDAEVTLGQLQRLFGEDGWLARRAGPDSEVFVFFAGHGMAELEAFTPYLLPADADPDYVRQTAFPVDLMIERLAGLGARSTTVFLDACFGGRSREGTALLGGARPLVLVPVQASLAGVSVFSAGTGNQIASSLAEQGHGLFSYHLFRGLGGAADHDLDRQVSAGELKHYLEDAVPRAAEALDREQFPAIALDAPQHVLVRLP